MKESKYPFVFVASVNIVHPPWAFSDVTQGKKKKPPSVYLNAKSRVGRVCVSFFLFPSKVQTEELFSRDLITKKTRQSLDSPHFYLCNSRGV